MRNLILGLRKKMHDIKLITFDLDDTFWDVRSVIVSAEKHSRKWVEDRIGKKINWGTFEDFMKIRNKLVQQDPTLEYDLGMLRKKTIARHTQKFFKDTKALNENQFTDLFQQAFPLCFSSNLEYWDSQDNELQFDRIIIIELAKVRANLAPALCSRSKSIIMFSRLVPNDPDSMAYYLDQMPLVRKLNLTGKYYNTCINLSQAQPHVLSRSFSRKIELHTTQGIFDVSKQINEKEADTVIHLLNTIEINKQTVTSENVKNEKRRKRKFEAHQCQISCTKL